MIFGAFFGEKRWFGEWADNFEVPLEPFAGFFIGLNRGVECCMLLVLGEGKFAVDISGFLYLSDSTRWKQVHQYVAGSRRCPRSRCIFMVQSFVVRSSVSEMGEVSIGNFREIVEYSRFSR